MAIKHTLFGGILSVGLAPGLLASQPMSAIDWLTDSVAIPPSVGTTEIAPSEAQSQDEINVRPIGAPSADGIGLVEASAFGLPADLWELSDPNTLARLIAGTVPQSDIPAAQALLIGLLTASAQAPAAVVREGEFFLARVDKLLEIGALDAAAAMLERSDLADARFFKRWFDVRLLQGTEDAACDRLTESPDLSPTFPATIFCLARAGNWDAAALTLDTAEALDLVSPSEDALLLRFLDETNAEEHGPLLLPNHITPLMFRLYEAVGEPIPTDILPRAFAHSDLTPQNGWKARLTSAERLASAGVVPARQLFDLYREQAPAASGSVWDRARSVQSMDAALAGSTDTNPGDALQGAWAALSPVHLGPALAEEYGRRLGHLSLPEPVANLAVRIALLRPGGAEQLGPVDVSAETRALIDFAHGQPLQPLAGDPIASAIARGFADDPLPTNLDSLVIEGRVGEAALIALDLLATGSEGDSLDLELAIRLLRRLGLDQTARQSALALLVQERRG